VVLAPDSGKIRARIESALQRSEDDSALLFVDGVDELIDLGTEAPKLAVLVCDLDRPAEMAMLRRVRRKLQRLAIVVVSPPSAAPSTPAPTRSSSSR
jgi:DNA-binding NarL/FixJ family response regulator